MVAASFALISILLWSSFALLGTHLSHLPPFFLVGAAMGLGAIPSLPWWRSWFKDPFFLAFGTLGLFGYHFFLLSAFHYAPPIEANLLNYTWPALIVLISPILLKGYALRLSHLIGTGMAFLGAAWIVSGGNLHKLQISPLYMKGYLLAGSAALIWALYSVLTKKFGNFPTSMVGGFCLMSSLFSFAFHWAVEPAVSITANDAICLLLMGLGPMGLAFYSWDQAMKSGNPQTIGALSYLTPLLSTWILVVAGGQPIRLYHWLSIVLIVGGAAVGSLGARARA
jgi:drug/metabolite transporter (DMT)-like permease